MTKLELMKKLEAIEGNPEIRMWNGIVQDYIDIDDTIERVSLVKESEEHIRKSIKNEMLHERKSFVLTEKEEKELEKFVKDRLESDCYDVPNPYVKTEHFKDWYGEDKEEVLVLNSKEMNKEYFDRMGSITY